MLVPEDIEYEALSSYEGISVFRNPALEVRLGAPR